MKKVYWIALLAFCAFLFASCGTTKDTAKNKGKINQINKTEKERRNYKSSEKNKKNKSSEEDKAKKDKLGDSSLSKTQVTETIPDPVNLIDKPNLELILPEEEDDDFDKDLAEERKRALEEAEANKEKQTAKEDSKPSKPKTKPKKKAPKKKITKKSPPKKVQSKPKAKKPNNYEERKSAKKNEQLADDADDQKLQEGEQDYLEEASANSNGNEQKDKEFVPPPDKTDEYFSEFPNTEPEKSEESYREEQPDASRKVILYKGQRLEVVYPGEGWVYLGETSAQKGIQYQQRIIQDDASVFNFGTKKTGTYILNFSYFDVFSDKFVTDSLMVQVKEEKEGLKNTVRAPDYKGEIQLAKNSKKQNAKSKKTKNRKVRTKKSKPKRVKPRKTQPRTGKVKPKVERELPPEDDVYNSPDILSVEDDEEDGTLNEDGSDLNANEMLEKIRVLVDEGKAKDALSLLETFFVKYSDNLDEAWFLRGQAYELNGKEKNIKKALHAYKTLTKAYPESERWDAADARIRYIKKFYINID